MNYIIMYKNLLITFILFVFCFGLSARELKVESFKLAPSDKSAVENPRIDLNGDTCALVKVTTPLKDCHFDGAVGNAEYRDGQYMVYLSPGVRRVGVECPEFESLKISFNDISDIQAVKSAQTYSLIISSVDNSNDDEGEHKNRLLSVREFKLLPQDIEARTREKRDASNEKCALIKISLPIANCAFDGIVGDAVYKISEYQVYLSPTSKQFIIRCPGLKPLTINIDALAEEGHINPSSAYSLKLNGYDLSLIRITDKLLTELSQYSDIENFENGLFCVVKNDKRGRVNTLGQIIVPCIYDEIREFSDGAAIVKKGMKYGLINIEGEEFVPCIYSGIQKSDKGVYIVNESSGYGVLDCDGKEILPCIYERIEDYHIDDRFIQISDGGKYGLANFDGEIITPSQYDNIPLFSDGLAVIWRGSKCGYINDNGEIVIPLQYDRANDFKNGYAVVCDYTHSFVKTIGSGLGAYKQSCGGYGIINKTGNRVTSFDYCSIDPLSESKFWVGAYDDNERHIMYGVLDLNENRKLSLNYSEPILKFSEGKAPVHKDDGRLWGYVNEDGGEVISCIYRWAYPFSNGIAIVENEIGEKGIINHQGKLIVPFGKYGGFENPSEGLIKVGKNGKFGFIDMNGQEILPCIYDFVQPYSEGLAVVKNTNGKYGYVNQNGEVVIPFKFDSASSFSEGLARVKTNHKWGYIDADGNEIIKCKYDIVGKFSGGLAEFELDGETGYVNVKGEEIAINCKY